MSRHPNPAPLVSAADTALVRDAIVAVSDGASLPSGPGQVQSLLAALTKHKTPIGLVNLGHAMAAILIDHIEANSTLLAAAVERDQKGG